MQSNPFKAELVGVQHSDSVDSRIDENGPVSISTYCAKIISVVFLEACLQDFFTVFSTHTIFCMWDYYNKQHYKFTTEMHVYYSWH